MLAFQDGKQSADLQQLQTVQKSILILIGDFCSSRNIPYFLVAGSALGAVRHGDMIPWDDDIDIGMLRSDYEHFKYEWSINPPSNLFLQDRDTEPKFPPPFIKIRKENTLLEESAMKELGIHQGIFVDIFPFDKIGKSSFLNSIQLFFLHILDLATLSVSKEICEASSTKFSKILRYIFFYLKPILNRSMLNKIQNYVMTIFNTSKSDLYCCFSMYGTFNFQKTVQSVDVFFPVKCVAFGDSLQPVPGKIDSYLTKIFGDYMQLPPEHLRQPHHSESVHFDIFNCK